MKNQNFVRINHQIRISPIQLIDEHGENVGIIPTRQALDQAESLDLDLVEVSPNAHPPVCRIMDYGKFKYQRDKKEKQKSKPSQLKEVRFRAATDDHDVETKMKSIKKFLSKGNKVMISVRFKSRENAHKHLGFELMEKLISDLNEVAKVQQSPKMSGRSAICILEPK